MGQGSKWAHCESLKVLTVSLKGLKCNSCFSCYIRGERVDSSQLFEIFLRVSLSSLCTSSSSFLDLSVEIIMFIDLFVEIISVLEIVC
ncbi:hypothetical protein HanRHA438_Chr04g0185761 [Helianthus annuus]|nr:hypothetical protein HanRHA438_Chr04g0185761 [Helianthus annuus]